MSAPSGGSGGAKTADASLLIRMRALRPSLSPAESRVADRVLSDPRASAALTISELAQAADTSETTVLRFCKRLGLRGYPQLRLALAEESAHPRTISAAQGDINAEDTIDDVIAKVAFLDASAVEDTASQLDRDSLTAAAAAIAGAGRVLIYGIAASYTVGMDLQQKLVRIGAHASCAFDPHLALTEASLLRAGDVVVGLSHSGTTVETVEVVRLAHDHGATTIAITNFPRSPIAKAVDIVLTTAARETALRAGATASRIAALTVVDCLFIAVAKLDLERATSAVQGTRDAVRSHHLPT